MRFRVYLLIFISVFYLSGCSNSVTLEQLTKHFNDKDSEEAPDNFGVAPHVASSFSTWYFESFPHCDVNVDTISSYELPIKVDLWDRIREGFALNIDHNKRIQQEMDWYGRHPSYLPRVTERGSPYLFHIVEELEKRNMPMELALLPIVESAFDPFAYSHGRASGMWQVIPGTGKMLGLKQNWWYDGRRDIVASTDAALNYLEDLNKRFDGDWLLALAAYNSGAGNVNKAIRRNKKKGKATDYWSLKLPRETQAYVPRLLALSTMVSNPSHHNIELHATVNEPYFEIVDVASQIDLAHAAELAEISMEEFYRLNPGFNRWATDPDGPHRLLLPKHCAIRFKTKLAALPPENRVVWDTYKVKSGDALLTIAKKFNTSVSALQSVNEIRGSLIRAGDTLLVPVASQPGQFYSMSQPQRTEKKQQQGDGHRQKIVVKAGDSFWSIGKQFGVSSRQVAKWNNLAPGDPIRPGQTLVVWVKSNADAATELPNNKLEAPPGAIRKVTYRVRNGDSLARIADKFNVRLQDIVSWNKVNPRKYLQPGDKLTLYVDVTKIDS